MHEPLVINTIGHSVGILAFTLLLYLIVNHHRRPFGASQLPAVAAAVALIWNLGSLIGLLLSASNMTLAADAVASVSFAVLSLLPAVLLHIALQGERRRVVLAGYCLSSVAVAMHLAEPFTPQLPFHEVALLLITGGFILLTAASLIPDRRRSIPQTRGRAVASMCLFLLAISFVHFGAGHARDAWSSEIALHHAGIPLAIFVVLQDLRFLILDAFFRLVANGAMAAMTLLGALALQRAISAMRGAEAAPALDVLAFLAACLLLAAFAAARPAVQALLSRLLFPRANLEGCLASLRRLARESANEQEYVEASGRKVAEYFATDQLALTRTAPPEVAGFLSPFPMSRDGLPASWKDHPWAQAVMPLLFGDNKAEFLLLGARKGGRRYLSEDLEAMGKLGALIVQQAHQLRHEEMRRLTSQAELKALQSQINPHFLFNALNTLYGIIKRDNAEARRLVLNLSEVFRFFLRQDRTFIPLEEELNIIRSYLAIEEARLGPRLRVEMDIDPGAMGVSVPALSLQPLVENAVKHGVAMQKTGGIVRLTVHVESGAEVRISVANTGPFRQPETGGEGIGLANVRRRLELCYGSERDFKIETSADETEVSFAVPLQNPAVV